MELSEIAKEVNKKLKLIPAINTDVEKKHLIKQLKELNDFIGLDKYLSNDTQKMIKGL